MKTILKIALVVVSLLLAPQQAEAQFFKRLAKKAQDKIEREADRRAERRVNKGIDKVYDKAEDEIDGKNKKKKKKGSKKKKGNEGEQSDNENQSDQNADSNDDGDNDNAKSTKKTKKAKKKAPTLVWNKFDFVPGDTVIFEDGPSADEENGEFPSRWDLYKGNIEIGELNGETVIMFLESGSIIPYLKNSNEDYLPEIFTIEMDVWFGKSSTTANRVFVSLVDRKNQRGNPYYTRLTIQPHGLEFLVSEKDYPGTENIGWSVEKKDAWHHISIAYTKGKYKAYFEDTRLINIPHLKENPTGITIHAQREGIYIKNIRITKGGVKYYDRVLSEGKIIVNGIKFDVNKATLKPESMGPINRIYKLMVKNPDLNFSVEGHTDSDGGDEANLALSKKRGKAVMDKLIAMGIDSSRLKYNGFGESKPIDNNATPEGKANNRRVEFVKF